ncbi:phospholipase effector Tle1 domain-containing protein [Marinimicrobium agarilyticum]|uniref:phospholipase effector Tle1 domain-containing protein n=1 Tax=Marinimicrobium agarilyticum TaxID=306546 RepID=UPI000412E864|nr:DUF2235 domain-containing protein [Marinimicrobium agarilyticum]
MTEIGEGAFAPPPPDKPEMESEEGQQELKVRLLLFFDGTLNNRTNVEQREKSTDIYEEHAGNGSYENDRSNIAILEANFEKQAPGYDATVSIYTEGPGTEDREADSRYGYALGKGATGIKNKVERGIRTAVLDLQDNLSNRSGNYVVKTIDVDYFGFSRGAAGARYCIYALNDQDGNPLKEQLESWKIPTETITNNFVGLFDTVSSYGLSFSNDVGTLKLDAISQAKKVVQLEASEEYRKNFSLTTIESAGAKGKRICLPGAHSDVGGGYLPGPEEQVVFVGMQRDRNQDYQWLIEQGWYQQEQMTLNYPRNPVGYNIRVYRDNVGNQFSRIPLNIMVHYMEKESLCFRARMNDALILPASDEELQAIKIRIMGLLESPEITSPSTWQKNDPLLNVVRNKYLHMSARESFGMGARRRDGIRVRQYYEG